MIDPINLTQLRDTKRYVDDPSHRHPDSTEYVEIQADVLLALIDIAEAAREAIRQSAIIIETLRAQDELKPYRELSPDFRAKLEPACNALRQAAGTLAKLSE